MQAPSTAAVLDCWDRLERSGTLDRAVGLVALFHPEAPADAIEDWPVGRRDAATLAARARLLGETIRATADCPRCGTTAELNFTAADVAAPEAAESSPLRIDDREIRLRPVTTRDLRVALGTARPRLALARACAADESLGENAVAAVANGLQALDPQADIRIDLGCDTCGTRWTTPFDVPGYVWAELGAWARRRLREVHQLASAYGWSERDILALSPARRDAYLAMCGE